MPQQVLTLVSEQRLKIAHGQSSVMERRAAIVTGNFRSAYDIYMLVMSMVNNGRNSSLEQKGVGVLFHHWTAYWSLSLRETGLRPLFVPEVTTA
jgi:hypothetical protein